MPGACFSRPWSLASHLEEAPPPFQVAQWQRSHYWWLPAGRPCEWSHCFTFIWSYPLASKPRQIPQCLKWQAASCMEVWQECCKNWFLFVRSFSLLVATRSWAQPNRPVCCLCLWLLLIAASSFGIKSVSPLMLPTCSLSLSSHPSFLSILSWIITIPDCLSVTFSVLTSGPGSQVESLHYVHRILHSCVVYGPGNFKP